MADALHLQIALTAAPDRIFAALTDKLGDWFAEYAAVSLPDKAYDFWGRYTPEAPERENGRHPLISAEAPHALSYNWHLRGADTVVNIRLQAWDDEQVVVVRHEGVPTSHDIDTYTVEDFWFLALENLRRHLDNKPPVYCDFSQPMIGDIQHTVEINGSAEAVFGALIRPDQLERWIASSATVEPVTGGRYDYGWGGGYGPVRILELVPNQKLSTAWPEESQETVVTWTLAESGGKTRLTIVHSGFAPDQKTGGLNTGWLNFLSWIKSMVEYGPIWRSPVIRMTPGLETIYPASIIRSQSELL